VEGDRPSAVRWPYTTTRIAFGGRGAPYHYGSRVEDRFDTDQRVRSALLAAVVAMLATLLTGR
jgi:hypothetical protein